MRERVEVIHSFLSLAPLSLSHSKAKKDGVPRPVVALQLGSALANAPGALLLPTHAMRRESNTKQRESKERRKSERPIDRSLLHQTFKNLDPLLKKKKKKLSLSTKVPRPRRRLRVPRRPRHRGHHPQGDRSGRCLLFGSRHLRGVARLERPRCVVGFLLERG